MEPASEIKVIVLNDKENNDTEDDEDDAPPAPSKKVKWVNKSRKLTKDYTQHVSVQPHIQECWDQAQADLKVNLEKFQCTDQNHETIKARLNGFCSHVCDQVVSQVPGYYGFAHSSKGEVTAQAKVLIPNKFHCNPDAKTNDFRPLMPLETIAFICTVVEFILEQFSLSDRPSRDKFDKMEFGPTRVHWLTHMSSLKAFKAVKPNIVESIQKQAWGSVATKLGTNLKAVMEHPCIGKCVNRT
ncbi:hypothetical protein FRC06_006256 [Ceratobasidium sp. 370]|nr:hypothetical protein FRC06_006256 [Ceratobasidium sp. 370]